MRSRLLKLVAATRPFGEARRGNVSILFAFSLLPLIGLMGLGVDYGIGFSAKSKLDNAADAAALAAVATAKAYVAANPTDPDITANAIAAGLDRARRAFSVNAGTISFVAVPTPVITLNNSLQTFSATVAYTTTTTTQFGRLFGRNTLAVNGATGASADVPSYLDFYLMIDVSGSMGLPSTTAGQTYLAQNNGGCLFACHFPGNVGGYNFALSHNIQLRSGAVNTAVCGLLQLAQSPSVPKQYRVGLYPFITQMATLSPISYDFPTMGTKATCDQPIQTAFTALLDTGTTQLYTNSDPSTGVGSGGTHINSIWSTMQTTVSPYGDGSSALKSKPFVFLITDGMQNSQFYGSRQGSTMNYPGSGSSKPPAWSSYANSNWIGGSSPAPMDPTQCSALKSAGATISILYIPYTTLSITTQNTGETVQSNNAVPQIPTALQSCASSGYFYTANAPADIANALKAMFLQAIQVAHLTH